MTIETSFVYVEDGEYTEEIREAWRKDKVNGGVWNFITPIDMLENDLAFLKTAGELIKIDFGFSDGLSPEEQREAVRQKYYRLFPNHFTQIKPKLADGLVA